MTPRISLIAAVILAATGTAAYAHSNNARLADQARWIEDGRRSGDITWREGIKLRQEQERIRDIKEHMTSDGRFTRDERRRLHRIQDRAQNHITQEASDGWRRIWWLPRVGR